MSERDFYTASMCTRLCLRRHADADSPEDAMARVKETMTRAVRAAVQFAHNQACDVDVDCDYLVVYPSVAETPDAPPRLVIRPFVEDAP